MTAQTRERESDGELDSVEEGRLLRDGGLESITLGVSEGVIFEDYVGVCCVALKRNVTLLSRLPFPSTRLHPIESISRLSHLKEAWQL